VRWRTCIGNPGATPPSRGRGLVALLAVALLASASLLHAQPFPRPSAVPGGIAKVTLGSGENPPRARVKGQRVLVTREDGQWLALVGIALDAKPGSRLRLQVEQPDGKRELLRIAVGAKQYASQHLSVPQEQVDLPAKELLRFAREQAHLKKVLATFRDAPPATLAMLQPVPGQRSATFGLRRYFNGEARRPHNGMDIAAPAGTEVLATAAGRVVDAGDYVFSGRTLILDHGEGLLSLYAHLKTVHASVGQEIAAGAPIGEVGATGRVTGPHLHFSIYLNAVAVDPALFLP